MVSEINPFWFQSHSFTQVDVNKFMDKELTMAPDDFNKAVERALNTGDQLEWTAT